MLNLDETTLSRVVNGFREPSVELKGRIAELLGCESGWLFARKEDFSFDQQVLTRPASTSRTDKVSVQKAAAEPAGNSGS